MRLIFLAITLTFCSFFSLEAVDHSSCYDIIVDTKKQEIEVFCDNTLVRKMPCSTGMEGHSTPKGVFQVFKKEDSDSFQEGDLDVSFFYITRFNGHIAFHSMLVGEHPFVREGIEKFEAKEPSSMGCVRLLSEDAKWMYESLPLGSNVCVQ
ncbi:MAG: L,D-transpeptidase family protein [Chlamydiales bacterium]|nr:L,D-transpeptidase [Chlamydiales bacterium]NCF71689.1 L,D-transpeptidase family protein [Chlamydiales bacterium]